MHYADSPCRPGAPGDTVTPQVRGHPVPRYPTRRYAELNWVSDSESPDRGDGDAQDAGGLGAAMAGRGGARRGGVVQGGAASKISEPRRSRVGGADTHAGHVRKRLSSRVMSTVFVLRSRIRF